MKGQKEAPAPRLELVIFKDAGGPAAAPAGWRERILDRFRKHLEAHGLKLTHQRYAILTHLLDATAHLTVDDIFSELKRSDPALGKATVFRTLNLLEGAGIVDRVSKADGKAHFEVKLLRPHHDHAICISCGAIEEIRDEKIEKYQNEAVAAIGFVPLWHRHEVFGRCRRCGAGR